MAWRNRASGQPVEILSECCPDGLTYVTWRYGSNVVTMDKTQFLMWFDPAVDEELPSLDVCLQRASADGVLQGNPSSVTHRAIDDAWDVVRVLRAGWHRDWLVQKRLSELTGRAA